MQPGNLSGLRSPSGARRRPATFSPTSGSACLPALPSWQEPRGEGGGGVRLREQPELRPPPPRDEEGGLPGPGRPRRVRVPPAVGPWARGEGTRERGGPGRRGEEAVRASPAKGSSVPLRESPGAPRVATALRPSHRRRARAAGAPRVAAQPGLRETLRLRPDAALRPGVAAAVRDSGEEEGRAGRRGCSARGRQQVERAPRPPPASRGPSSLLQRMGS
ncbi:LHFPL tetraspan subfamily member 6 protein isoform X1 [Mustela putorius furo]|uniref:LHFPL tetraspan subfamily member 6 protein isoform X1 n=1 Tax=Mustela putorius furo TaxID=9669 RepID=M3YED5_MUSPF|nr:LHFPL tetraspan subfamily member 6 protein isoform X1 [Mustela putorius furo]